MNKKTFALYFAGLMQGIALVAFPAMGALFTDSQAFNFSSTIYGSLFIPQALLSLGGSILQPDLSQKKGGKWVFLCGLMLNLIAMGLLSLSVLVMHRQMVAYLILLVATGCLGLGFGLLIPTLNELASLLYPKKIEGALLKLNALLGTGTALAPVFISLFTKLGYNWGLPALLSVLLICLVFFSSHLIFPDEKALLHSQSAPLPSSFWLFASFALLYGIIETLSSNWSSIHMKDYFHASLESQSLALTAFWTMVTLGRVFFALIGKLIRSELTFQFLPLVIAIGSTLIALSIPRSQYSAILEFGLIGLGCSALLPLIINFGKKKMKTISSSVPGKMISFYLLGYGLAAFGVGPLKNVLHFSLREIYASGAVFACALTLLAIRIKKV